MSDVPQPTVHSIQVGLPRRVEWRGESIETAIFKSPVLGPVRVGPHNLDGDRQADTINHGGSNKAIYAYPLAHYPHWAAHLNLDALEPGHLGENLTIAGIDEREARLGERWHIGSAVLEVAQPRKPCAKLGLRVGDPHFVKAFLQSGRPGIYLAVVQPGTLSAGDPIERDTGAASDLSVYDIWALAFDRETPAAFAKPCAGRAWARNGCGPWPSARRRAPQNFGIISFRCGSYSLYSRWAPGAC